MVVSSGKLHTYVAGVPCPVCVTLAELRSGFTALSRDASARRALGLGCVASGRSPPGLAQGRGRKIYESGEELTGLPKRGLWVDQAPVPPWEWRKGDR